MNYNVKILFVSIGMLYGCTSTYKISTSLYNGSNETVSTIGIQKGYSINPKNQPNVINNSPLAPKETYMHPKKIKVKKGQSLFFYVSTPKTNGFRYSGYHMFDEKENNYTYPINIIDTNKAFTEIDQIKAKLDQIGITDIDRGSRIKMEVITSDISNILNYLPALAIVDTTKIKNNLLPDNSLYRTYYRPQELGIIPEPLVISGNTIKDNLVIESDGNLSSQFTFPMASNLNLNINNKGYYKVNISIKDAGWIPVSSVNYKTPFEAIFHLDSLGQLTTLADMYSKLKGRNRLYTVEEGFVFSELVSQTIQYTESNVAYEGNYASVITSKGGYVRSENADHIDTRPTTLVYVSLTNDKTDVAKEVLKNILLKDYIAKYIQGAKQNEKVMEALPKEVQDSIAAKSKPELQEEIKELKKDLEQEKKTLSK